MSIACVIASACAGAWWHWMGTGVTREGIVGDIEWMAESGIGTAVIFSGADIAAPGPVEIAGGPGEGLVAATPKWWRTVRFAVEEASKRGIEIGLHNCPGYSHSGGPWTTAGHAMRELVFVVGGRRLCVGGKERPGEMVDAREVARYPDAGLIVCHVAKASFNSPAQKAATGYECDKMSAEAVNAHWDRVLGDVNEYLGDYVGRGLGFLHVDSYEAGDASWTPKMREEFERRRGYDPLPYLPALAGLPFEGEKTADAFKADFKRTVAELYRDNFFAITRRRLHAAGLEFSCEPYGGPFVTKECSAYVDRLGTEFWTGGCPWNQYDLPQPGAWGKLADWHFPHGAANRLSEAEALTGWPESSRWDETPAKLKPYVDYAFVRGINRLMLHSVALQPWGDGILPGMTFGCWGTHFGRTQTWAKDSAAFFGYINNAQRWLQWGDRADELKWPGGDWGQMVRKSGDTVVRFLVNPSSTNFTLTACGEWYDPATDEYGDPPAVVQPWQSGFLITGRGGDRAPRRLPSGVMELEGEWTIEWKSAAPGPSPRPMRLREPFFDWTASGDDEIRHFSGTAKYSLSFDCANAGSVESIDMGDLRGNSARVVLNGRFLGTAWAPPRRLSIPDGTMKCRGNVLEIEYTNVWANRLIGDERYGEICERRRAKCLGRDIGSYPVRYPDFLKTGNLPPGTLRRTFSMWNYFSEGSPLVPSGMVGPVKLLCR